MLHSPSGFPSRISCRIIGCDFSSPDTFTYRLLKAVSITGPRTTFDCCCVLCLRTHKAGLPIVGGVPSGLMMTFSRILAYFSALAYVAKFFPPYGRHPYSG